MLACVFFQRQRMKIPLSINISEWPLNAHWSGYQALLNYLSVSIQSHWTLQNEWSNFNDHSVIFYIFKIFFHQIRGYNVILWITTHEIKNERKKWQAKNVTRVFWFILIVPKRTHFLYITELQIGSDGLMWTFKAIWKVWSFFGF